MWTPLAGFAELNSGKQRTVAHRTIALPPDAVPALELLTQTLPALLKESGLPVHPTPAPAAQADPCPSSTWTFAPPAPGEAAGVRACRAIAIGTLLPVYDSSVAGHDASEAVSPAKLAWLAQAYVLATPSVLAPASAQAINGLASRQLGLPQGAAVPSLAAPAQSGDPVVSRLARLKGLYAATERSPARSSREARERRFDLIVQRLPAFAGAVFGAAADFDEAMSKVVSKNE